MGKTIKEQICEIYGIPVSAIEIDDINKLLSEDIRINKIRARKNGKNLATLLQAQENIKMRDMGTDKCTLTWNENTQTKHIR
jgi:hypothetical protein